MNFKVKHIFKSETDEETKKNFNLKWAKILIFIRDKA